MPKVMRSRQQTQMERQYAYREAFLTALSRHVAVPSDHWPTVRCWTKHSLDRVFKEIKNEIGQSGPAQSNATILDWIVRLGLARAVEADGELFYLLEIGAGSETEIEPAELLMAYRPDGVICYFSAISLHSLTTQIPSHHHIAIVRNPAPSLPRQNRGPSVPVTNQVHHEPPTVQASARAKPSVLGKKVFSYSGVPYYQTERMRRLMPGVQRRANGPREQFRITTLEQTLLDTFHKPQNCGGPAVVLEAWETAVESGSLDEKRLLSHLKKMEYKPTTRRLGALLRRFEYTPGEELDGYLTKTKATIKRTSSHSEISLLPGLDYSNLDEDWLVHLP